MMSNLLGHLQQEAAGDAGRLQELMADS